MGRAKEKGMADFNQRFLAYVKALRATQFAAVPTQAVDSNTVVRLDLATMRANLATKSDLNTVYYLVIP